MNTWFTSDTHYNHKNIVRGTTDWKEFEEGSSHQSLRDFDTLEDHNDKLVDNFNKMIKPQDEVWHLGDVAFGGHQNIKVFMDRLNCKNINLVFGNHDQHIEPENSVYRGLFKSCQYVKNIKHGNHKLFLSHYSHRVWAGSHKSILHLYGHSHGSISNYGKSMDVGIDSAKIILGDYRPFSIEEVINILNKRNIEFIDHHSEKTN